MTSLKSTDSLNIKTLVDKILSFNEEGISYQQSLFKKKLVKASLGIGDCIDERPCRLETASLTGFSIRNRKNPKPSFVGGAAGFVVLYMVNGLDLNQAVEATKKLYQQMNWGDMEIHIDDEHGQIQSINDLKTRNRGCGFLGVIKDVVVVLKEAGLTKVNRDNFDGQAIFNRLKENGAKVVVLAGEHKLDEATFVINDIAHQTLPKDQLFEENPAFCWDRWATVNQSVLDAFNNAGSLNLELERFKQLQTALHLVTGLRLGALRLEGEGRNLVILKN